MSYLLEGIDWRNPQTRVRCWRKSSHLRRLLGAPMHEPASREAPAARSRDHYWPWVCRRLI